MSRVIWGRLSTLGIQSPCQRMIGVSNHLLRKVFRFHYHSQKVIGSLGQFDSNFVKWAKPTPRYSKAFFGELFRQISKTSS